MATWASCKAGNSPAATRRLASSLRWRRFGRPGSERELAGPGMAVLPSRPGSACFGRERLAVERSHAPGELAALPADPEAAGTRHYRWYSPDRPPVTAAALPVSRGGPVSWTPARYAARDARARGLANADGGCADDDRRGVGSSRH